MADITPRMVNAAFDESMAVRKGQKTFAQADRFLEESYDFNLSSAKDYTRNLHQMLDGKRFTRTLNAAGTRIYLTRIRDEVGQDALELALESIEQHIAYYENLSASKSVGLRDIVSEFESIRQNINKPENFETDVAASLSLSPDERAKRLSNAPAKARSVRTTAKIYLRNPDVVAEVLFRAEGICEHCHAHAPFLRKSTAKPYLEVHHRLPLAEGGDDTVENAIALCPNCHREAHYGENWKNFRG